MRKIFLILLLTFLFPLFLWSQELKRVLVLPFEVYSQQELSYLKKAIPEMLASRLFSPEKILVIEPEKVEPYLKKYSQLDKKVVQEIAKELEANYVIWGSVSVIGEVVSIDAQIIELRGEKKPGQFFQEVKGLSEVIPQLSRFARKAKKYIEGKEEDFYQEELSLAMGGGPFVPGRYHPERGYLGYPLYPIRAPKEEIPIEKAKPRFGGIGDPTYEGLTKDLVIELSGNQPRIGFARSEEDKAKGNQTSTPSPYLYYYPPQPYYNYSPPPYYYYPAQPQEEGFLSKMKRTLWPFSKEEVKPIPLAPQPQPVPLSPQPLPPQPKPHQPQSLSVQPLIQPQPQPVLNPPQPPNYTPSTEPAPSSNNPWRWE